MVDSTGVDDDGRNFQRAFWRWLQRQPWRRMLPEPFVCHGLNPEPCNPDPKAFDISIGCVCLQMVFGRFSFALRVNVMLQDPRRDNPLYVGQWQMFRPSDLLLGCKLIVSC